MPEAGFDACNQILRTESPLRLRVKFEGSSSELPDSLGNDNKVTSFSLETFVEDVGEGFEGNDLLREFLVGDRRS